MPPEVLALSWALLFVVGSGVVYRFFSWLRRRSRARHSPDVVRQRTEDAVVPKPAAPLAVSAPPAAAPVVDAPRPAPPPSASANVPRPAPARHYAAQASDTQPASSSVQEPISVGILRSGAIEADNAPSVCPALKPSIAATLPPKIPLKASIAATLPPEPVTPRLESPVVASTPSDPITAEADPTASEAIEDPVAREPLATDAPLTQRPATPRSVALRAWKLGEVAPRLDIRLKETRNRKVIVVPKALRKPPEKHVAKEMKVLAPRIEPEKAPVRRVGRKVVAETILASTQAQTRVVGVPQRGYRILATTEL
ncbi:hypothetical protein [Hyphomicrobium sp. 99]|uniref:hypothetical protein n=1 Tax=Hyphomicrobium sp. 99 TaxID=1163419 RepID=UPI0005F7681D|nr:hypothetical protein [Hyphomicrobium sp. 99]